jgi:hypothetical protein
MPHKNPEETGKAVSSTVIPASTSPIGTGAAAADSSEIDPDTGKPYFVEPPPGGSAKERVVMTTNTAVPAPEPIAASTPTSASVATAAPFSHSATFASPDAEEEDPFASLHKPDALVAPPVMAAHLLHCARLLWLLIFKSDLT